MYTSVVVLVPRNRSCMQTSGYSALRKVAVRPLWYVWWSTYSQTLRAVSRLSRWDLFKFRTSPPGTASSDYSTVSVVLYPYSSWAGLERDSPERCARSYERNRGICTPMLSCSFQTERTWHWNWPKTPVRWPSTGATCCSDIGKNEFVHKHAYILLSWQKQ